MTDFAAILPAGQAKIEEQIMQELELSQNGFILDDAVLGCLSDQTLEDTLLRDFGLSLTPESKAMVLRCIDKALTSGY